MAIGHGPHVGFLDNFTQLGFNGSPSSQFHDRETRHCIKLRVAICWYACGMGFNASQKYHHLFDLLIFLVRCSLVKSFQSPIQQLFGFVKAAYTLVQQNSHGETQQNHTSLGFWVHMLCQGNMFPLRHGAFEALKFDPCGWLLSKPPQKKGRVIAWKNNVYKQK